MGTSNIPSIPDPGNTLQSMQQCVLALKQAVEIFSGTRGNASISAAATTSDITSINNKINSLNRGANVVNATKFGADPTGANDSTGAIQAAINSLPPQGGKVVLDGATFTISQTLNLGNGTSSLQSTQQNVYLVGLGNLNQGSGPCTTLSWAGASNDLMVGVNGPIQGWGVENLVLNGQGVAGFGIQAIAACGGSVNNVTILSCKTQNFYMKAYPPGGVGHPDSQLNDINNLVVFLPAVANVEGITLDSDITNGSNNSSFNTFRNCLVVAATSSVAQNCYYLKGCDSNTFICCSAFGGGSGTIGIVFDYNSVGDSGAWPANNTFLNMDTSVVLSGGASYFNVGTPGAGARPNRFFGVSDTNTETYPKIANTSYVADIVNPGIALTGQTGSIATAAVIPTPEVTGIYRISWVVECTTAGSAGTVVPALNWEDDAGNFTLSPVTTLSLSTLGRASGTQVIRCLSGNDILYNTTVSGATGSPVYALFIKVEKLD